MSKFLKQITRAVEDMGNGPYNDEEVRKSMEEHTKELLQRYKKDKESQNQKTEDNKDSKV